MASSRMSSARPKALGVDPDGRSVDKARTWICQNYFHPYLRDLGFTPTPY